MNENKHIEGETPNVNICLNQFFMEDRMMPDVLSACFTADYLLLDVNEAPLNHKHLH